MILIIDFCFVWGVGVCKVVFELFVVCWIPGVLFGLMVCELFHVFIVRLHAGWGCACAFLGFRYGLCACY